MSPTESRPVCSFGYPQAAGTPLGSRNTERKRESCQEHYETMQLDLSTAASSIVTQLQSASHITCRSRPCSPPNVHIGQLDRNYYYQWGAVGTRRRRSLIGTSKSLASREVKHEWRKLGRATVKKLSRGHFGADSAAPLPLFPTQSPISRRSGRCLCLGSTATPRPCSAQRPAHSRHSSRLSPTSKSSPTFAVFLCIQYRASIWSLPISLQTCPQQIQGKLEAGGRVH